MTEQAPSTPEPVPGVPPPSPQRPSRTPLIIAAVIVAVLVVVALGAVGLLAASDGGGGTDSDTSTSPASPAASAPDPATEPSGETLEGDGYSYDLPVEWQDITEAVLGDNPGTTIDSASAWGPSIAEGRANLIVEHPEAGGVDDLDTAREELRANLEASFESEIEELDNRDIGGLEMAGLHVVRTNEGGVDVDQTAWITLVDGSAYIITSSRKADDEEPEAVFEAIYDSWSWE